MHVVAIGELVRKKKNFLCENKTFWFIGKTKKYLVSNKCIFLFQLEFYIEKSIDGIGGYYAFPIVLVSYDVYKKLVFMCKQAEKRFFCPFLRGPRVDPLTSILAVLTRSCQILTTSLQPWIPCQDSY